MRKFIAILFVTLFTPSLVFGNGNWVDSYNLPVCTNSSCNAGCYSDNTTNVCDRCNNNQYSYISNGQLSVCTTCNKDNIVDSSVNFTADNCCVRGKTICCGSSSGGLEGDVSQMKAARANNIGLDCDDGNYLQRACIKNIEWTGPGSELDGCNAKITCADGRYWGGESEGCVLCADGYAVKTNNYSRYNIFYGSFDADDSPCQKCLWKPNGSQTSCQFGVSYGGYLDKDGNEVNGNTTYYNVGSTFTLLSKQRVEAGKHFVGWTCQKDICTISSCAVQTCFYTEPGQTVTENSETFYYFTANAEECPTGFYCPGGTATPQPCPDGLTTKSAGAKSVDECGVKGGVTVFKDSKGTFKLPGDWFAYPAK